MVDASVVGKHQAHVIRQKQKVDKSKSRIKKRKERKKSGLPAGIPHTLESLRKPDETFTDKKDEDIVAEHNQDEFSDIYQGTVTPKILVTHSDRCCPKTVSFCKEFSQVIPNATFAARWHSSIKKLVPKAIEREFTAIIIFGEDKKKINNAVITHLPNGPTMTYKVTNLMRSREFKKNRGKDAEFEYDVIPQLLTMRFATRVGVRVERSLGAIFPEESRVEKPKGHNRVVVFHNQRDYIFFRHYRYQHRGAQVGEVDEEKEDRERVVTNEIGPRFTLKLLGIQMGTFDSKFGNYEWVRKRKDMDNSRRSFVI